MDDFTLTVGPTGDGRKVALISVGGHPQKPNSGRCDVIWLEVVTGWGRKRVQAWFDRMLVERPWETRQ